MILKLFHIGYRAIRPIIFCINSEIVHEWAISAGEYIGRSTVGRPIRWCLERILPVRSAALEQTIAGIHFANPIGLAAGFDYEARLTQITKAIGFGFSTIGTITNMPYEGNKKPRLGRLVKSRSLVVNKGFKNLGIDETLNHLARTNSVRQFGNFPIPVGISIGKTNTRDHTTQQQGIDDIVGAFIKVEKNAAGQSGGVQTIPFSYYELNISCPNLHGPIEFYSPANLEELLVSVFKVPLTRPVFIKMPIGKTNEEVIAMLTSMARFPVVGVIIGNLSGDRDQVGIVQKELAGYPKGGLSGMATQLRSDELIALVYFHFGKRFVIVGCGGVFDAADAYRKIRSGASLIQFITGMVFEGPQLPAAINKGLVTLLSNDGFTNVAEAVGADFQHVK